MILILQLVKMTTKQMKRIMMRKLKVVKNKEVGIGDNIIKKKKEKLMKKGKKEFKN